MSTCTSCDKKHYAKGLCKRHYQAEYRQEESRKAAARQRAAKWRSENLEKVKANNKARSAAKLEKDQVRKAAWAEKNRDRLKAYYRERSTGISASLFSALLEKQNGRCAVCEGPFSRVPFADHCHDTKTPRGLLCHHCNAVEGHIKVTGLGPVAFAERLQAYLSNPPAIAILAEELTG